MERCIMNNDWRHEYEKVVLDGDIKTARQIVRENASRIKLLKFYRGTQLQLNTVMSGKFWLSNAKFFNDPYDSLPLANLRSKLQYDRYNPAERKLALEEYERQAKSDAIAYAIQSSIFVSCLTETSLSNLHMWSYYADEHKGFCVEYSLQKLLDNDVDIFPVVYTEKWDADRSKPEFNTQVALIKGIEWAHENEWRVVCVSPNDINEKGIKRTATMPEAIYVGCHDREHITDNWNLYRNLAKTFKDNQQITEYVFWGDDRKVSLDEILDQCQNHTGDKIPIFAMTLNEGRFGLRQREVIY